MEITVGWAYFLVFAGITANVLIIGGCFMKRYNAWILGTGVVLGLAFAFGTAFFVLASPKIQVITWGETGEIHFHPDRILHHQNVRER